MTSKSYRDLHDTVVARPGATGRAPRRDTGRGRPVELRRALQRSQTDLAAALGISHWAISQLERGEDVKLSTLRSYIQGLGAKLQILAVSDDGESEMTTPIRIGADAP